VNEWRQVKLGDIADEVTVGHVGSMTQEYRPEGIPLLRSQNVLPHGFDLKDVKYINRDFHARLKKSALRAGDVVTVRTGKPGATAVVPAHWAEANCSDLVITRPGSEINAHWLSYYINSAAAGYIDSQLVGAVQQHFNVGAAKNITLNLPPLPEQKAIAEVLGALDDKISANTKQVELADELAASLTRYAVGTTESIALSEIADIVMGSSPSGTSFNEIGEGTVFYQGVRDFGVRFPSNRVWTTAPARLAMPGDTLLSVRAPVGRVNLATEETCIGRGVASVRSSNDQPFTLFHLLKDSHEAWAPFEAEGTVFGSINKAQLASLRVPRLRADQQVLLETKLAPLEHFIASALAENPPLAETRDALLPLLMSGKLRVKDAEKVLENAGV
jgi:type I restriction enzyme S subunit